jgi:SPP1 gp7 family putative phage head morphogenesis protein|nr:MAG TPA: minor capsid component [Caudoviricetes sp.]
MDVPPFISLTKEEDIEEIAKKWASVISNKYAREDAEEAARIVLRSGIVTELPDLREADLGGKKRFFGLTRADFHAAICEGATSFIRINKRAYKTWKKDSDDAVRGGWHAQGNTILHELGHYIDFCNDPDFFRSVEHEWKLDNVDRKFVKKQLSEYSLTNRAEFEAELNSAILSGKVFPEEILELSRMKQTKTPIAKQLLNYGSGKKVCLPNEDLTKKYKNALKAMFRQEGSTFTVDILGNKDVQEFISTHATMLNNSFKQVKMSDKMRERLTRSNYIFSGIKTFHELNEAFPSMLDENGNKKPFERFLNDVQKINDTYNANYLHAEYNFVQASATMAAKWEQFSEDGDRYYLQYRTAKDDKVRPEHAALDGVTLPMSDSFWETYYPPNGWNCRCTVVQVRKQKYPATEHTEAMSRGEEAMNGERYNIFRFNSGKQGKTVPDYNPYTIKRCNDCDVAKGGNTKLGFVPDYQLCQGCIMIRKCNEDRNRDNSAKATKKSPEVKKLQGTTISNPDFNHEVLITGGSIKEWTNQPHKEYAAKNSILKHIDKVFREAKYIGFIDNFKKKPGVKQSHLFETNVLGELSWIIVREYEIGEFVLHSISDSDKIKTGIRKE